MPELPEVEALRLGLKTRLVGSKIIKIKVKEGMGKLVSSNGTTRQSNPLKILEFENLPIHKTIVDLNRRAKNIMIHLDDGAMILVHLKMTGQFFFVDTNGAVIGGGHSMTDGDGSGFPHKHSRIALHFGKDGTLYFNDMRLFGYLKLATAIELEKTKANYGPEPINTSFDTVWFTAALKNRRTSIKAALLNQSFVAGLGNIYVDEALWRAKVAPTRLANTVTNTEAKALALACGDVMNESIKVGGTTFQHFVDTDGNIGNFTQYLKVFGKQGTPCPRCKTTIIKIRCAGRGTHYCPKCQK